MRSTRSAVLALASSSFCRKNSVMAPTSDVTSAAELPRPVLAMLLLPVVEFTAF
jgi:hypothetical protein